MALNLRSFQGLRQWRQSSQKSSLTIGNEMFGLLGTNRAGKSSLMRTAAILQDPDSGSVTRAGIDPINKLIDRIPDDNTIEVTIP